MKNVTKTTMKAKQPAKLSKTRKATIKKKKAIITNLHAANPTWRPKAKTKREKELKALGGPHFRRERSTSPCALVVNGCKKLALKGFLHCSRHVGAGYNEEAVA